LGREAKDHTVPKFYLNGFADRSLDKGDARYVWVYEKGKSEIRKASTREVAHERDFYHVIRPDGTEDKSTVDDKLKQLESDASGAFRVMYEDGDLDRDDRLMLALFIATMYLRVPKVRGKIQDSLDHKIETDQRFADAGEFSQDSSFWKGVADWTWFEMLSDTTIKIARILLEMKWTSMRSLDIHAFVTSDNPVFLCPGLLQSDTRLSFPISSKLTILASWDKRSPGLLVASDRDTVSINRQTISSASRFVYASFESQSFNETFVQGQIGTEPGLF
jgi:hypothetical protein